MSNVAHETVSTAYGRDPIAEVENQRVGGAAIRVVGGRERRIPETSRQEERSSLVSTTRTLETHPGGAPDTTGDRIQLATLLEKLDDPAGPLAIHCPNLRTGSDTLGKTPALQSAPVETGLTPTC